MSHGTSTVHPGSLCGYGSSDIDSNPGSTSYFGFINPESAWYIMELTSSTVRYVIGTSDYTTNWTNRASLSYDYYNNLF